MPTNRLANETSLYLRQHAHNPIDWYPWGDEAFAQARERDCPVFLSIGYSACHWCHVMERESFTDPEIAAYLNDHFVSIKVDREERPDVDQIYMDVVQALTGAGGWPLTLFLDPEGKPLLGGTYFPPAERYGKPSFGRLIRGVADAWDNQRDLILADANDLLSAISSATSQRAGEVVVSASLIAKCAVTIQGQFDPAHGGFSSAPKFPSPTYLGALLTHHARTGDATSLDQVETTLTKMHAGGVYDHLGGGFHRYSTDARWRVPHFEKMLYDNAQLVPLYLECARRTGESRYADIARHTLTYMEREMRAPSGGFYATQDADSEGEEGRFFVWTREAILEALGEAAGVRFCRAYGVTVRGNFEGGRSVLHRNGPLEGIAPDYAMDVEALAAELEEGRRVLFELREERIKPARDEKHIAAWNGLALRAFAHGAALLADAHLLEIAEGCARFIDEHLTVGGELHRIHNQGQTRIPGFLEDHAYIADALLDLFHASGDPHHLTRARALCEQIIERFYDAERRVFYVTSTARHDALVRRPASLQDGSTPCAAVIAMQALLRVAHLTEEEPFRATAEAALAGYTSAFAREPRIYASLATPIALVLDPPQTCVIAGAGEALAEHARRRWPVLGTVIELEKHDTASPLAESHKAGREAAEGRAAAYVCRGAVCSLPVTDVEALNALLTP